MFSIFELLSNQYAEKLKGCEHITDFFFGPNIRQNQSTVKTNFWKFTKYLLLFYGLK